MKRILLVLLAGGVLFTSSLAQDIELTGFFGYMINTDLKTYYGTYQLDNNPNYGGIFSVEMAPDMFAEFLYNRTDTEVRYIYNNETEPLDMSTEYFQVGGLRSIGEGRLKAFGVASLGAARFHLKESYGDINSNSAWSFAGTLGLGAKVFLSNKLGVRLQARMNLPLRFSGLWIGTGGTGGTFLVPLWQFDFTAGLFLRLGY